MSRRWPIERNCLFATATKVILVIVTSLASCTAALAQSNDSSGSIEVERWLAELSDDSFAARQRAMQKIWRADNLSVELLRRYAATADAETAERINRILMHIEMGITPETDAAVARLVYSFHSADEDEKFSTIYKLRDAGRHKWVMDLLMTVNDLSLRSYLAPNAYDSGAHLASLLMPNGFDAAKLDELDLLMDHAYMWHTHVDDCVIYWRLRGQAELRIRRLTALADGNDATDEQLMRLVWYFRSEGNHAEAIKYAKNLLEARPEVVRRLQLETGDWASLRNGIRDVEENTRATRAKRAMFAYWLGDQSMYQEELSRFPEPAADSPEELKFGRANTLAVLAILTMDRQALNRHFDRMSPGFAMGMLVYLQDYEQAFRLRDAPESFPEIKVWYRRQLRQLRRHINVYQNRDASAALVQAKDLFDFLCFYASARGMMGGTAEAIELYELLGDALKVNGAYFRDWNARVFEDIARLNVGADIWHFYDILEMRDEVQRTADALFPKSYSESLAWYRILEETIPDPAIRFQTIAGLLKGPHATDRVVDLDAWLVLASDYIQRQPEFSQPRLLFQLGNTCQAFGRLDQARDFWLQAGFQGDADAFEHLGDQAFAEQDWRAAKRWFLRSGQFRSRRNPVAVKSAICDFKLGDRKTALATIDQFRLMTMNSYPLLLASDSVQKLGFPDYAGEFGQQYVHGRRFRNNDLYYQYSWLARLLDGQQNQLAALNYAITIYFDLNYLNLSSLGGYQYHANATRQHVATALHLLEKGDTPQAMKIIKRCIEMREVSSTVAETFVTRLDALGRRDLADEIFDLVADKHVSVLKKYPESSLSHNNYAWECIRCHRRLRDALRHAERAVEIAPNDPVYLDTLAEACFCNGELERAIQVSKKCVELDPFNQEVREKARRFANARNER